MRCKIKAADRATYEKILALVSGWGGIAVANSERLLISAEFTAASPILDVLELGGMISKEEKFDLDG